MSVNGVSIKAGLNMRTRIKKVLLLAILALSIFPGYSRSETLKKVTFLPQWFPQAQFAGYYVAKEKGFYAKYGIDVTILRGGPNRPVARALSAGEADFATMFLTSGIHLRSEGVKVVNIAQVVQRSGLIIVAKKANGITRPEDLNGKKVSLWPDFRIQPLALFRKYNVKVKEIQQAYTLNLFLRGGVDAASAMWYNEYHSILSSGINPEELSCFFLSDYDKKFPEDGIYCLEKTWKKNPKICRSFARASLEGWRYAFDNPAEALDIVMKYVEEAQINTSRTHQKWMLEKIKDIILPAGTSPALGILDSGEYINTAEELKAGGLIKRIPRFSDFYVNSTAQK